MLAGLAADEVIGSGGAVAWKIELAMETK